MKSVLILFAAVYTFQVSAQVSDAKVLIDSAEFYLDYSKPVQARAVLHKALPLTDNAEKARSLMLLGECAAFEGYAEKAFSFFRQALAIRLGMEFNDLQARIYNGTASARVDLALNDSSLYFLNEAWKLDSGGSNGVQNLIIRARYWQAQNEFAKSLEYFQQAERAAIDLDLKSLQATALTGMASLLFSQDPGMKHVIAILEKAQRLTDSVKMPNTLARNYVRLANASMVLSNTENAARYLNKAKTIIDRTNHLPVKSYLMASFSILKAETGDIVGALEYAKEPAIIKRELGQRKQLQNDLLNIAEYQMHLKKFPDAYATINEGIDLSSSLKDYVYLQYFHERHAQVDSLTGDHRSAYRHIKKSIAFKDSVVSLQRMKAVDELQEKYEAEQREKVIAEKELVIERQKFTMALIGGATIAVLITGVLGVIVIRNKHRLRLQTERERQRQLQLETIVKTQEEVQQSIARDIHDGLVQMMGAAKLTLSAIPVDVGAGSHPTESIQKASSIIDEACQEARHISHQLLPYSLLRDGLASAIEDLLKNAFGDYYFSNDADLHKFRKEHAIHVYRIAQEVINNILKHAEADKIWVELGQRDNNLIISFRDNGVGFDINRASRGAGLLNIQTRADLLNAVVDIESAPGKGAFIRLTIPNG